MYLDPHHWNKKHHIHYHAERGDPSEVGLRHPDGLLANLCWKIRDGHKPDGENYKNQLFLCTNKDMYTFVLSKQKQVFLCRNKDILMSSLNKKQGFLC